MRISLLAHPICCGAFLTLMNSSALAQDAAPAYPTKSVRILVGYAAGGGLDVIARIFGQRFTESMGQTFLVENRPGAGGNIATDLTAKAAADGYTLNMAGSSHAINVSLYSKLPYDAVKDFAPVSLVAIAASVLVAHPSVPVNSLRDLIALAQSKSGQITYSSSGSGTPQHLAMELFRSMAGIQLLHVPYGGGAPAITAALAGQVQLHSNSLPTALPHVRSGKLRALGVTSAERSQIAPEIPTVAEAGGLPGYEATGWYGLLAPAGTPAPVIRKINGEIQRLLLQRDIKERLITLGFDPYRNSPEEFTQYIQRDIAKWGKVVRESGAKAD